LAEKAEMSNMMKIGIYVVVIAAFFILALLLRK